MQFQWDEEKNKSNQAKHGFDFVDAYRVFESYLLEEIDQREDYGEVRVKGTGVLDGRIVVIVFSEPDEETIRVISLRKALTHERKQYERELKDRLG
jgi:uncharacterized DUF497 family protein